jgi:hypothetical protein
MISFMFRIGCEALASIDAVRGRGEWNWKGLGATNSIVDNPLDGHENPQSRHSCSCMF